MALKDTFPKVDQITTLSNVHDDIKAIKTDIYDKLIHVFSKYLLYTNCMSHIKLGTESTKS